MAIIRWLGKILLWTVIIVVVLAGTLLLVNAVDEDLRPEVAAALKPPPATVPDEKNGFFVIMGFYAPSGTDPHAYGRQRMADYAAATSFRQVTELDSKSSGKVLSYKDMKGRYCGPPSESCFSKARQNAAEVRALLAVNGELMQRYESLYQYARVEDVIATRATLSLMTLPPYGSILNAQSLKLGQIALLIEDGRIAEALDELERDIALHRNFVEGSTSILAKMISTLTLSQDYLFLSDVMREKRAALEPHAQKIRALAAPLAAAQRNMEPVFLTEFRFTSSVLRLIRENEYGDMFGANVGMLDVIVGLHLLAESGGKYRRLDWMLRPFLKDNATLNGIWPHYRRLGELSRLPAGRIATEYQALQDQVRADVINWLNWKLIFNPIGKLLFALGTAPSPWSDYVNRVNDVDGLTRLAALQAEIVLAAIPDTRIQQFLATTDKKLFDPYTDKPMQWDAAARQLWFEPRSERFKREKIGGREGRLAVGL